MSKKPKRLKYNPRKILDLPLLGLDEELTIGEFFMRCLDRLWDEGERFSGKRPYGDSDWENPIYEALVRGRYLAGTIEMADDGDGPYVVEADYDCMEGHRLIARVLSDAFLMAEVVR